MILYHGSNTGNIKVLKPFCKYFVMESTLSNFFPNLFNRVHFRRIWWQGTPGRIPFSHQQYLGLLIRPNPASFRNTNRIVFPLWITFSSWTVVLIFLRPLFRPRWPSLGACFGALLCAIHAGASHNKSVLC